MSRLRAGFVMFKFAISSLITVFCAVAAAQAATQGTHANSPSLESLYDAAQQSRRQEISMKLRGTTRSFWRRRWTNWGTATARLATTQRLQRCSTKRWH